jgi:hypothetical protein
MDGLLIVPYQKTRYHLREWDLQGRIPENMKELFNLRHSSLRTVVERAFGVLKWRFQSLRLARKGFSIRTQVKIVYACVALHNWMIHRLRRRSRGGREAGGCRGGIDIR